MEFFSSLVNRYSNGGIINQARFISIHDALLQCLENSAGLMERQDHKPGKICLKQTKAKDAVIRSVQVVVNRDYAIIFPTNRSAEALIIMKRFGGKYICIHGDTYNKTGKKIHVSIKYVPQLLMEFIEAQYASTPGERNDITVSCLT